MDILLAAMAAFAVLTNYAVYSARSVPRTKVPWIIFLWSLLATELAWLWLTLQIILCAVLWIAGAGSTLTGQISLGVLLLAWLGLLCSIYCAVTTDTVIEQALQTGLGVDYRQPVAVEIRDKFRSKVGMADWCNPMDLSHPDVEVLRNIPYGPAGVRQQLDIYRPRELPEQACPVLLQIHGGGWMMGDKGHQALPLMTMLASKGWICVAANYRLSPSVGFPTHLEDCKSALCWIRKEGREYGMDTDFVAVTGGSAGGQLATLMALTANRPVLQKGSPEIDTSVQACVPFYGVYDFLVRYNQHPNHRIMVDAATDTIMHESPEQNPALWDLASPITQIHAKAPPFFVLHGRNDSVSLVGDARVFCEKLRQVSESPVVYAELPGAEHAFDCLHSPRAENTIDGVHRFLEWARVNYSDHR